MSHQSSPMHLYSLGRNEDGRYSAAFVQAAWWAWQARAALAAPAPQAAPELPPEQINAAAKAMAKVCGYSWAAMGEPGHIMMRDAAMEVIGAAFSTAHGITQTKEPTNDR